MNLNYDRVDQAYTVEPWLLFKGHLHSRDAKFVPEKHPRWIILSPFLKGHLYSGERDTFPRFNLHSRDTLALKNWLITKKEGWYLPVYTNHLLQKISQTKLNSPFIFLSGIFLEIKVNLTSTL